MPKNPIAIKTIVTTEMIYPLAKHYNVEIIDVLIGFKFICEQIGYLEKKSEQNRYIFGFEESYGYLSGSYVRDKDGVNASLLICEMAAYYKNQNKTLIDILNTLYEKYGYYQTALDCFEFLGNSGFKKMESIMKNLTDNPPKNIINKNVIKFYDYNKSIETDIDGNQQQIKLPKSNIVKFLLDGNNSVIIRPSGTEPKLKIYYSAKGQSENESKSIINQLKDYFSKIANAPK